MKKITILIPSVFLFASYLLSCSKNHPKPITFSRLAYPYPKGSTVLLMPIDSRIAIKSKVSSSKRNKYWKASVSTAQALQNSIPSYLTNKKYFTNHILYWSGAYSGFANTYKQAITPREYAALFYSLADYAFMTGKNDKSVQISPRITSKLSSISDYTFYTASWTTIKYPSKGKFHSLKRAGAILLITTLIIVVIFALAIGGDSAKGVVKTAGNLVKFAFRGVFSAAKHIPIKSILKSTVKVAKVTTKIAGRVSRTVLRNGYVRVDIPLNSIEPVYVNLQPPEGIDKLAVHNNQYLGVKKGVSFLLPFKDMKSGYMLAFVLIHNKTSKVAWSTKIWIPEGISDKKFNNLIKNIFLSLPEVTVNKVISN